jgi:hypothetical protein
MVNPSNDILMRLEGAMLKKQLVVILALLTMTTLANAKEIAGVNLPAVLKVAGTKLVLNGAGVRTKFFIQLYVGGLYLAQSSQNAGKIIEADEPMAIRLHMVSSKITSEKMEKATREGFAKSTGGNMAPIETQIENFISVFRDKINKNDIYDLVYLPGKGVEVYKNGKHSSLTPGLNFKQALFGIWLSEKPAQTSLKKKMLGK